ncbi:MAG: rhodanese-like domain-containing protein [Planctomycetota bacterium]|jgi:rhodanese-related sulfurtransferase|nr:rhodanese-like domain-containing protein [Planctomycetota bacterium]
MRTLTLLVLTAVIGLSAGEGDISHADLVAAINAKSVVLLDVNGSESYAKAHIPGALDFEVVKASLAENLPADKDTLIVAYCGGPKCKAWKDGAKAAKELGYTNIKHYSAGLIGWVTSDEGKQAQN